MKVLKIEFYNIIVFLYKIGYKMKNDFTTIRVSVKNHTELKKLADDNWLTLDKTLGLLLGTTPENKVDYSVLNHFKERSWNEKELTRKLKVNIQTLKSLVAQGLLNKKVMVTSTRYWAIGGNCNNGRIKKS